MCDRTHLRHRWHPDLIEDVQNQLSNLMDCNTDKRQPRYKSDRDPEASWTQRISYRAPVQSDSVLWSCGLMWQSKTQKENSLVHLKPWAVDYLTTARVLRRRTHPQVCKRLRPSRLHMQSYHLYQQLRRKHKCLTPNDSVSLNNLNKTIHKQTRVAQKPHQFLLL